MIQESCPFCCERMAKRGGAKVCRGCGVLWNSDGDLEFWGKGLGKEDWRTWYLVPDGLLMVVAKKEQPI